MGYVRRRGQDQLSVQELISLILRGVPVVLVCELGGGLRYYHACPPVPLLSATLYSQGLPTMPAITRTMKRLVSSRPYVIRGASMTPTLQPGDHVLVDVSAYLEAGPDRGDIVVFYSPQAEGRRDIKRVVGLPGERVVMAEGMLFVSGDQLSEPYLGGLPSSVGLGESAWDLGAGEYLVLGDNRAHSTDGREFGPIGGDRIVGRAWVRYWPVRAWAGVRRR